MILALKKLQTNQSAPKQLFEAGYSQTYPTSACGIWWLRGQAWSDPPAWWLCGGEGGWAELPAKP